MKRVIILLLILMGCSSERADWDSGAAAKNSFEQERQEEQTSTIRNQFPDSRAGTDTAQPF
jgi:hypothetical protein